jgi:type IV pilus assembly protein PilW
MRLPHKKNAFTQTGFSLVELMVGLVIGLIATLVISQAMGVFQGQQRTTSGTADAQTNGGIALFTISRDLKQAGFGLMPMGQAGTADSALDCTTVTATVNSGVSRINPVDITDGVAVAGVSASDTITIRYGTGRLGGAITTLREDGVANTPKLVASNLGCANGDVVIVMSGGNCTLTKLANNSGVNAVTVANAKSGQTVTMLDAVGSAGNDFACLGAWNEVTYRVFGGNLQVNGTDVVSGVVNLQAQYGVSSTPNSNQINKWVDAGVDADGESWATPTPTLRKRIKAVRIAVVARNPQLENAAVTNECSSTTAASPTGLCAWEGLSTGGTILTNSPAPAIDLSPDDANWARYHYSVFESIIPIRNTIWAKDTL